MKSPPPRLILASTSPYRRALLARLGLPFETVAPRVDETALAGESPEALALRLARAKAREVGARLPEALVIGSDQVAALEGAVLDKPGTTERARAQLLAASGRCVRFLTALCVLDTRSGRETMDLVPVEVEFRVLTPAEVDDYLERDRPLDCAGAFRSEALGVTLVRRICGEDPTALVGLPLIRLSERLAELGCPVLASG